MKVLAVGRGGKTDFKGLQCRSPLLKVSPSCLSLTFALETICITH